MDEPVQYRRSLGLAAQPVQRNVRAPNSGITRSTSREVRSYDNARAEGFFGTLKCDFFEGRDWTGVPFGEFSRLLGEYIEWYRDGKLKKDLGWKTIREYREERGHAA